MLIFSCRLHDSKKYKQFSRRYLIGTSSCMHNCFVHKRMLIFKIFFLYRMKNSNFRYVFFCCFARQALNGRYIEIESYIQLFILISNKDMKTSWIEMIFLFLDGYPPSSFLYRSYYVWVKFVYSYLFWKHDIWAQIINIVI